MSPRSRADLALAGNTLIWGSTFVVVKQALDDVSPLLFLAMRFSLATAGLYVLFRPRAQAPPAPVARAGSVLRGLLSRSGVRDSLAARAGFFAGLLLFAGYATQTVGLRFTTPPKSAFLTALSIPVVPLLLAAVYRIRPRPAEIAGVLLATLGMGLITLEGATAARINRGDLLTILCALAFAGHILAVGHYSKGVEYQTFVLGQISTAALLSLAVFWWAEPVLIRWTPGVLVAVAATGLIATALAFAVQAWAQRHTTPTRTALIFSLEPVFAWLTSFLLGAGALSPAAALGAGLILAGILLVELKPAPVAAHP